MRKMKIGMNMKKRAMCMIFTLVVVLFLFWFLFLRGREGFLEGAAMKPTKKIVTQGQGTQATQTGTNIPLNMTTVTTRTPPTGTRQLNALSSTLPTTVPTTVPK